MKNLSVARCDDKASSVLLSSSDAENGDCIPPKQPGARIHSPTPSEIGTRQGDLTWTASLFAADIWYTPDRAGAVRAHDLRVRLGVLRTTISHQAGCQFDKS